MRFILLTSMAMACAPPPPIQIAGGSDTAPPCLPAIDFIRPQQDERVALDDNCELAFEGIVDIDDFELVAPSDVTEEQLDAECQGHIHYIYADGPNDYDLASTQIATVNVLLDLSPGQFLTITASLQNNGHVPLVDLGFGPSTQRTIELTVGDNPSGTCGAR